MRTFGTMAAALGLVGAIAIGTTAPAAGDWYGHHHRYYTITVAAVESGTAAGPAGASGPWDFYGGRQSDCGY